MKEYDYKQIAQLVIRSAKGDSDAFAGLYALTYDKTYRYAYHYLKDSHLAQDALQEIYIQALKNIDRLSEPTLFIAWLNRISFHVCYDMSRKLNQFDTAPAELMDLAEVEDDKSTPENLYVAKSEYETLHDAIEQLPFHEKQVIVLRFYRNMKLEEIADTLAISKSSVKRHIISAKEHLKLIMTGKEAE